MLDFICIGSAELSSSNFEKFEFVTADVGFPEGLLSAMDILP